VALASAVDVSDASAGHAQALVAAGHARAVKAGRTHALHTASRAHAPNVGRPKDVMASHAAACRWRTKAYPRVSSGLIEDEGLP